MNFYRKLIEIIIFNFDLGSCLFIQTRSWFFYHLWHFLFFSMPSPELFAVLYLRNLLKLLSRKGFFRSMKHVQAFFFCGTLPYFFNTQKASAVFFPAFIQTIINFNLPNIVFLEYPFNYLHCMFLQLKSFILLTLHNIFFFFRNHNHHTYFPFSWNSFTV